MSSPPTDGADPDARQPTEADELVARCVQEIETEGDVVVDRVCAEHPELADEIRSRLEHLHGMGLLRPRSPRKELRQIGPHSVLRLLGTGGMGEVYLCEQRDPVVRRVAVKVIRVGMDTDEVVRRFEAERQVLALMNHPNIAGVYDAGLTEEGRPYFVMEYVAGAPITTYCDTVRMSTDDRLELFTKVCDAVQHAHHRGVLHRDLKPSNILVTEQHSRVEPKIIDFGIAKAAGARFTVDAPVTVPGQMIGTPEYMSPEQAASGGQDVDTRTDVYSLGVVLYELLCGELPFDPKTLRSASAVELHRILHEEVPRTPSTRATRGDAATTRRTDPASLRRRLRGDLDWIVLRALEKDRSRRYPTVLDLAADIRRHLAHEPVVAGPPTLRYRFGKLVRRHRVEFSALATVMIALIAGLLISWRYARLAEAKAREFDQLAGVIRHEQVLAQERYLYPAWPEKIESMERWLADVEGLRDMRTELRKTVARIESRASGSRSGVEEDSRAFLLTTLEELIDRIAGLEAKERKGVVERLDWARRVRALTEAHPRARVSWAAARAAIAAADDVVASARYRDSGIDLRPQTGLVPIGMNPLTKLWEFYHLRSAWSPTSGTDPRELPIPSHRPDGSIDITEATGIVFVLLPGGAFLMGSQTEDPHAPNYDPGRMNEEGKLHEETVQPFFLARHELTQGQWMRLMGGKNPSRYPPGFKAGPMKVATTAVHPVEQLTWTMAQDLVHRHGLALPSEAEWEYACRAETTTPWYSGVEPSGLRRVANVLDQVARLAGWQGDFEAWDDGYMLHAPVGSYEPNRFGLFDMHGNVWEWCALPPGVKPGRSGEVVNHVFRGGSFYYEAKWARASARIHHSSEFTGSYMGMRTSRPLKPGR